MKVVREHYVRLWNHQVFGRLNTICSGIVRLDTDVGNSTKHGHDVPLVLDLETGSITSQYHVVFDDQFQTVQSTASSQVNFEHDDDDWYKTLGLTPSQYIREEPDSNIPLPEPRVSESEGVAQLEQRRAVRDGVEQQPSSVPVLPKPDQPVSSTTDQDQPASLSRENDPPVLPLPSVTPTVPPPVSSLQEATNPPASSPQREYPPLQRENTATASPVPGISVPVQEVTPPADSQSASPPSVQAPRSSPPPRHPTTRSQTAPRRSNRFIPQAHYADAHECFYNPIYVGKAKKNTDPDTFTWDEAMASPYKEEFLRAAQIEINALVEKGTWEDWTIEYNLFWIRATWYNSYQESRCWIRSVTFV